MSRQRPNGERLPELVGIPELSRRLGLSRSTLYTMHADGRLPGYRVGSSLRFDVEVIRTWLEGCREGQT